MNQYVLDANILFSGLLSQKTVSDYGERLIDAFAVVTLKKVRIRLL